MVALSKSRGVSAVPQCYHGQLDEVWYFYDVAGSIATGDFVSMNPGMYSSHSLLKLKLLLHIMTNGMNSG